MLHNYLNKLHYSQVSLEDGIKLKVEGRWLKVDSLWFKVDG
jgi:hypothetical protein